MADEETENSREQLLNFNPPPLGEYEGPSPNGQPMNFFDTHLDEQLVLKRVRRLPSLPADLSKAVDDHLMSLPITTFPSHAYEMFPECYKDSNKDLDAEQVFVRFQDGISNTCGRLATGLMLHSASYYVNAVFHWYDEPSLDLNRDRTPDKFVGRDYALCMAHVSDNEGLLKTFVNTGDRARVLRLEKECPVLAVGMFFATNAKQTLSDMEALLKKESFPWYYNSCPSGHPPKPTLTRPPDAPQTLWSLPELPSLDDPPSRIVTRSKDDKRLATHFRPKTIKEVRPHDFPYTQCYLQCAWNSAVLTDSTAILFDCGNYIRIGIRHRQSQTLFLSEMINVCSSDSPHYGKLILGLHIAIAHDALQRQAEIPPRTSAKRPSLEQEPKANAKKARKSFVSRLSNERKPKPLSAKKIQKAIHATTTLLSSHSVLAVYINFGYYNSPNPGVLLRPGRSHSESYAPRDYAILHIHSRLGRGATGDVFRADVRTEYFDSPSKYSPIIAKLATNVERLRRLRHEYFMYCHLQKKGVLGIPVVFGYYQDYSRRVGALLLNDVGRPLAKIRRENKSAITDDISAQLKSCLKSIHDAGVLHRDVRSWNIMVDEQKRVTIIDFDRASLKASPKHYEEEVDRLERLIAGEHVDIEPMVGADWMETDIDEIVWENYSNEEAKEVSTSIL